MSRTTRLISSLLSLSMLGTVPAYSSGFSIFEQGAKASGMAGAFAATADDPSAMFYNVAGIAHQRRLGGMAGATIITFNAQFQGAEDSYPFGEREFFEDHTFTPPNAYAVIPIGENATLGFGQFTAFGLRTDWADEATYSGRYISTDANLKTASFQPSFAMRTSDGRFAWGVGLEYRLSHVTLERYQGQPFVDRIYDVAKIRLDSDWNEGWGWTAGVLYRPNTEWSVGLSYRAPIEIEYEGEATFTQIPTGVPMLDAVIGAQLPPDQAFKTSIDYPAFIHAGIATTRWDGWTVEFDAVYNTWSEFSSLLAEFEQTPARNIFIEQNWDDSYSLRLGGNREVTDRWDVRLGAVYDTTPQPLSGAGPLLPDADRYGITYGLGFEGAHWFVDASHMFLIFEERDTRGTNHDNFNGTYNNIANLLSFNVGYRF